YAQLQDFHKELPAATSKQEMLDALRAHESIHPELCDLERSEDQFYGFTKGANLLRKHLEWAFVPAVKDAAEEQLEAKRTALGLLLDRTVRSKMSFSDDLKKLREEAEEKYAQILGGKQGALSDLSSALTKRLREWAHPDAGLALNWRSDPSKNISIQEPQAEVSALDGSLQLAISRMGHGLQRSFLLALLQELSGCPSSGKPKLLLACEEPELYQHPPQARHLSSVLQNLSSSNAQVMVCTHSPLFVQGRGFPDVRLFRRAALDDQPSVHSVTMEDLAGVIREARGEGSPGPTALEHKIQQILQPRVNEMFFTPVLILVEGDEDLAYVETYLALSGCYDDFRRLGCHVVPTSGKGSMVYALGIARQMDIPTFLVFDADGDKASESEQPKHERDNLALLRLAGVEKPQAFPPSIFSTRTLIMWPKQIGRAVREDVGEAEWERCETVVRDRHRLYDLEKSRKSALYIGMTLTVLYEGGGRCKPLEFLCKQIISFAQGERSTGYGPPAASAPDIQPPTTPVAQ
ncbi:MAG TPA: AAA family ATPase, partial [Candidatus Dormibacteraeota bacterium]|nr:AAA family ATPase [Candidatus Dormibacteraeota bacterium]